MSNFKCEKCGTDILEDEGGHYYTECEHYPLEEYNAGFCRVCLQITNYNIRGECLKCIKRLKEK